MFLVAIDEPAGALGNDIFFLQKLLELNLPCKVIISFMTKINNIAPYDIPEELQIEQN